MDPEPPTLPDEVTAAAFVSEMNEAAQTPAGRAAYERGYYRGPVNWDQGYQTGTERLTEFNFCPCPRVPGTNHYINTKADDDIYNQFKDWVDNNGSTRQTTNRILNPTMRIERGEDGTGTVFFDGTSDRGGSNSLHVPLDRIVRWAPHHMLIVENGQTKMLRYYSDLYYPEGVSEGTSLSISTAIERPIGLMSKADLPSTASRVLDRPS